MDNELGKVAYEAYCEAREWKSFNGDALPHWNQQSADLRLAWIKAAKAVDKYISIQTSRG